MSGVVFSHTVQRNWRAMLYWGIGLALYGLTSLLFVQDTESLKRIMELMDTMPPALLQAFGLTTDMAFIGTPDGFLSARFFGFVILMLAVYAVQAGLNVTANEEDQGIMDVVLSLPLPRWRIIAEKSAAYTLLIIGISLLSFVGLWVGTLFSALSYNLGHILQGSLNLIPSTVIVFAFTVCATAFIRNKSRATALAAIFVVISYILNVFGSDSSGSLVGVLSKLSFLYYYDNNGVMQHGLALGNVAGLLIAAVALVAAGVWAFQRRDVGI